MALVATAFCSSCKFAILSLREETIVNWRFPESFLGGLEKGSGYDPF